LQFLKQIIFKERESTTLKTFKFTRMCPQPFWTWK